MKHPKRTELVGVYLNFAKAWNNKHRIFGSDVEARLAESESALRGWPDLPRAKVVVDVGAGAGIMGLPLLWLSDQAVCVFVEPDPKKSSFLLALKPVLGPENAKRVFVIPKNLEDVSRETLEAHKFSPKEAFLVSRAFSGAISIEEAYKKSIFCEAPLWVFGKKNSQSELTPLHF